jgi:hypothetical protein
MAAPKQLGGWLRGVVKEAPSGDTLVIMGAGGLLYDPALAAALQHRAGQVAVLPGSMGTSSVSDDHATCLLSAVKSGIPPEKRLTLSSVIAPKLVSGHAQPLPLGSQPHLQQRRHLAA